MIKIKSPPFSGLNVRTTSRSQLIPFCWHLYTRWFVPCSARRNCIFIVSPRAILKPSSSSNTTLSMCSLQRWHVATTVASAEAKGLTFAWHQTGASAASWRPWPGWGPLSAKYQVHQQWQPNSHHDSPRRTPFWLRHWNPAYSNPKVYVELSEQIKHKPWTFNGAPSHFLNCACLGSLLWPGY